MKYSLRSQQKNLHGEVELPVSKSFANRYISMKYLAGQRNFHIAPDFPDDVNVLIQLLNQASGNRNAKDAGTAMRFSTALLSAVPGEHVLEGEERMHERPIGILVEALRKLGADIRYLGKEGYPPLEIRGRTLEGGSIDVPAHVSSQFVSALLMIAPVCENEVVINLQGTIVSAPYIQLTLVLMRRMGVEVEESNGRYWIKPQTYRNQTLEMEKDWSSAAFIFQLCALSDACEIFLPALRLNAHQGDKITAEMFRKLGVESQERSSGVIIRRSKNLSENSLSFDFKECPDLVQPMVMTCLGLGLPLTLSGLHNLHLKESNRLEALKHNVEALGSAFEYDGEKARLIIESKLQLKGELKGFSDHRMIMSMAPLALKLGTLELPQTEVVSKSFPGFWTVLKNLGMELIENP